MTEAERRRAEISLILDDIEALHKALGIPADELEVYQAKQAVLAIENRLRRDQPQAAE